MTITVCITVLLYEYEYYLYYVQYITYSIAKATGGVNDTLEGSDFFHGPRAKLVFSY